MEAPRWNVNTYRETPLPARGRAPGEFLLGAAPIGAALLIAFNDFWLKPKYPGVISGKLSDVGLCFFFPLFVAAAAEWMLWPVTALGKSMPALPRPALYAASCWFAAAYFTLIKLFDSGAKLHVELLSTLFPTHGFRAVADPTDLLCLPLVWVAHRYLERSLTRAALHLDEPREQAGMQRNRRDRPCKDRP